MRKLKHSEVRAWPSEAWLSPLSYPTLNTVSLVGTHLYRCRVRQNNLQSPFTAPSGRSESKVYTDSIRTVISICLHRSFSQKGSWHQHPSKPEIFELKPQGNKGSIKTHGTEKLGAAQTFDKPMTVKSKHENLLAIFPASTEWAINRGTAVLLSSLNTGFTLCCLVYDHLQVSAHAQANK